MSKDDYHVLAYKILAYLYECLKQGEHPSVEYLSCDTKAFPVGESYWNYVLVHLLDEGYVEGIFTVPIFRSERGVKGMEKIQITPKGIEYLQDNSKMKRVREFLKGLKETIPGI